MCLPLEMSTLGPFPYLQRSETVVLKEGKANDRDQKKLQAECIILTVKRFPKFPIDHVHCDIGAEEKNHLTGVPKRRWGNKGCERNWDSHKIRGRSSETEKVACLGQCRAQEARGSELTEGMCDDDD